ncbi:tetratricopeptide repeat protein [Streptacidiphilus sp. PAMC 29251]
MASEPRLTGVLAAVAEAVPRVRLGESLQLLPMGPDHFTDRRDLIKELDREHGRKPDGSGRCVQLHGPSGIGATALALHWGWSSPGRFPDGQIYLSLRREPADLVETPSEVLAAALRKLGVHPEQMPVGEAERSNLFRSLVTGRRMLFIVDNVRHAGQISALLTPEPDIFLIAVANARLTGLNAPALLVGPLPRADARKLLTRIAGKQAVAAARATMPSLLDDCAGLPWAVRTAAAALSAAAPAPSAPPTIGSGFLDSLLAGLDPAAAQVLLLTALCPWPTITPALASAATGLPAADAERTLSALAVATLLRPVGDGAYTCAPALRDQAKQAARRRYGVAACNEAVLRSVEHLRDFAVSADVAATPKRWWLGLTSEEIERALGAGIAEGDALALLVGALDNVLEALCIAAEHGRAETVFALQQALWSVQLKAGHVGRILPVLRIALRVVSADLPGPPAARTHVQIAFALMDTQEWVEAEEHLRAAADIDRRVEHWRGLAAAQESLGLLMMRQWLWADAEPLFEQAKVSLARISRGGPGWADVPRATALNDRHLARALGGQGKWSEADQRRDLALAYFRQVGDTFNEARTLTDHAEALILQGDLAAASVLVETATDMITRKGAAAHLPYLSVLRAACRPAPA